MGLVARIRSSPCFPLPPTNLSHGNGAREAGSGGAVADGGADLNPRHSWLPGNAAIVINSGLISLTNLPVIGSLFTKNMVVLTQPLRIR